MLSGVYNRKRLEQKDTQKLEEMRLLYSSRAEKPIIMKKIPMNMIKIRQQSAEKKRVKLLIQLPQFQTECSEEELKSETPNIYRSSNYHRKFKRQRLLNKSDLEKIYQNFPKNFSPTRKYSTGFA